MVYVCFAWNSVAVGIAPRDAEPLRATTGSETTGWSDAAILAAFETTKKVSVNGRTMQRHPSQRSPEEPCWRASCSAALLARALDCQLAAIRSGTACELATSACSLRPRLSPATYAQLHFAFAATHGTIDSVGVLRPNVVGRSAAIAELAVARLALSSETQSAGALAKSPTRKRRRTPATSRHGGLPRARPFPWADSRRESAPRAARSGESVRAPLAPTPRCAESKADLFGEVRQAFRIGARAGGFCQHGIVASHLAFERHSASRSTTPRDGRRRAPSPFSGPGWSSRPNGAGAPVRAAGSGSVRRQKAPASPSCGSTTAGLTRPIAVGTCTSSEVQRPLRACGDRLRARVSRRRASSDRGIDRRRNSCAERARCHRPRPTPIKNHAAIAAHAANK